MVVFAHSPQVTLDYWKVITISYSPCHVMFRFVKRIYIALCSFAESFSSMRARANAFVVLGILTNCTHRSLLAINEVVKRTSNNI